MNGWVVNKLVTEL